MANKNHFGESEMKLKFFWCEICVLYEKIEFEVIYNPFREYRQTKSLE